MRFFTEVFAVCMSCLSTLPSEGHTMVVDTKLSVTAVTTLAVMVVRI